MELKRGKNAHEAYWEWRQLSKEGKISYVQEDKDSAN